MYLSYAESRSILNLYFTGPSHHLIKSGAVLWHNLGFMNNFSFCFVRVFIFSFFPIIIECSILPYNPQTPRLFWRCAISPAFKTAMSKCWYKINSSNKRKTLVYCWLCRNTFKNQLKTSLKEFLCKNNSRLI